MDFKKLLSGIYYRCRNLILQPKVEWECIKTEQTPMRQLVRSFLFPLLIAVALASVLGKIFSTLNIGYAAELLLSEGLHEFFGIFIATYASVFMINELVKSFGGTRDLHKTASLVIYSMVPYLLVSIVVGLIPSLYALSVLGLYSFFLFYEGVQLLFDIPAQRMFGFFITAVMLLFVLFALVNYLLSFALMLFTS